MFLFNCDKNKYAKGGKVKSNKENFDIIIHNYIVYLRDIERICVEIREELEDIEDDDFPIDSDDIDFFSEFLDELVSKEESFAEIRDKIVDND